MKTDGSLGDSCAGNPEVILPGVCCDYPDCGFEPSGVITVPSAKHITPVRGLIAAPTGNNFFSDVTALSDHASGGVSLGPDTSHRLGCRC